MASYTTHGRYIPGTGEKPNVPMEIAPECPGRFVCKKCSDEIYRTMFENKAIEKYYNKD